MLGVRAREGVGEGEAKTRTFSCSTEESGLESGPPSSSCSSPPSPPVHPCSEGESETSDYPRQSPSPGSEAESGESSSLPRSSQQMAATRTRRATVPPHSTRLRVSLHRLPLATVHNKLTTVHDDINNKLSKVVVHQTELRAEESKLVEQGQAGVKDEQTESKLEDMKLEMAKLDSILQGNLLLDKSSHKISDMLLLDTLKSRVKQEYPKLAGNYGRDRSSISCKDEAGEEVVTCKWEGCGERLEPQQLLDHLTDQHVSQPASVGCRWTGCKVFGAVSSSRTWLSHHVTSHVGSKPFLCIVAGCRQRFGTQISLSRHVNSHFKPPCTPSQAGIRRGGESPSKATSLQRKTRRKLSLRSNATTNNTKDLFHVGVMAGVKDGLARLKPLVKGEWKPEEESVRFDRTGQAIVLRSKVTSRRLEESGDIHYLISWLPEGMLPDEWVPECGLKARRRVPISHLPPASRQRVEEQIFGSRCRARRRKQPLRTGPAPLT